jgi:aminoglycoside phosphotransferase (APT) family kinase protein
MDRNQCPSIAKFARQRVRDAADLELKAIPLPGGLESGGVFKVELTWPAPDGQLCSDRFVAKRLVGGATRELEVWKALGSTAAAHVMPAVYGAESLEGGEAYVYQEFVESASYWPWAETSTSVAVLSALAHVHSVSLGRNGPLKSWDYESELSHSARRTVDLFASAVYSGARLGDRPMLRALERTSETLPAMRTALQAFGPTTLLHGDVHAGNAVIRKANGTQSVIFLDWGRARLGSPLEDVSSWLQSVGFWEPEVKRRHDTLLRSYLGARSLPDQISPELRELYWIAAACNAMAGALRYHLAVMLDPGRTDQERSGAFRAMQDWLRIVRRTDTCWRN